jgi:hypothetical protein
MKKEKEKKRNVSKSSARTERRDVGIANVGLPRYVSAETEPRGCGKRGERGRSDTIGRGRAAPPGGRPGFGRTNRDFVFLGFVDCTADMQTAYIE